MKTFGFVLILLALALQSPVFTTVFHLFFLVSYATYIFKQGPVRYISIDGVYVVFHFLSMLGNLLCLLDFESFHSYVREEYLIESALIELIGDYVLLLSIDLFIRKDIKFMPLKRVALSNSLIYILLFTSLTIIFLNINSKIGTFSKALIFFPIGLIFYWSLNLFSRENIMLNSKHRKFQVLLLYCLVISLTIHSFFNSYLRSAILMPSIAYLLGNFISDPNPRFFLKLRILPVFIVGFLFYSTFSAFGTLRSKIQDKSERLEILFNSDELLEDYGLEDKEDKSIWARKSTLSQISAGVELTARKGFYYGETLEYLAYVFIPRFIWANKPLVMQGQWFAVEIGNSIIRDLGKANNSINMTIKGELFINFGWIGMIIGLVLFAFLIAVLWNNISFHQSKMFMLSGLFGVFIFNIARGGFGSDLQIIVSIVSFYLILWAITLFFSLFKQDNNENTLRGASVERQ
jgi:hypothetical protein